MATNPFAAQIAKEEKQFSTAFSKAITKAVTAKDIQKKADDLTNKCGTKPEKKIATVFENAANAAIKKLNPGKLGIEVVVVLKYKMNGAVWNASAEVQANYIMVPAGGKTHRVKQGENLWVISEQYFGSGGYWPLIAKDNAKAVKSQGDFIVANVDIKIPKIDIIEDISVPVSVKKQAKPVKDSSKNACVVQMPTLIYDLSKSKVVNRVFKVPGMTINMKITLKGELKATKKGALSGSFNVKTFDADVKKAAGPFVGSIKITKFEAQSISLNSSVANTGWSAGMSISKDGRAKVSLSPQSVKFKSGDFVYEGSVGMDVECQFIPDASLVTEGISVGAAAIEFISENKVAIAGTVCVVIIVGVIYFFPPTAIIATAALAINEIGVGMIAFVTAVNAARPALSLIK